MLDLHRLRLLRELKHRGTLAAVAEALSYSPSTISQQISLLEAEAGVALLEHVGRRVRLTEQAEILVAHTEAVLGRLERAEAEIAASLGTVAGVLKVAAFQSAALALIPAMVTRLRAEHPALRVEVSQAEPEVALPALLARDFDLVIGEEYPGSPIARPAHLELADLCLDPLRLAGPAPLASLAGHPWAMEPAGTASRQWATRLCRAAGFEPDARFESPDLLVHLRLVEAGHAAAFIPDLIWTGRAPTITLHELPGGLLARRLFTAVRRGGGTHPAVRAARTALLAAVPERLRG